VGRSDEEKRFSFEFPGKKSSYEREETVYKSFAWNYTGQDRRDDLSANAPGTTKNRSAFGLFIYTLHAAMCFSGGERARRWKTEARDVKLPSHSPLRRTCCILKQIRTTLLSQTKHKAASGVRQWFVLQREEIKTSIH
jgi:hypothetical protein